MEMFKPFKTASLLVHITFHYMEERIKYLKMVLDAIDRYEFQKIDVIVDTNVSDKGIIDDAFKKISLRYSVHKDLTDPFLLTWQHRAHVEESIEAYDYFMYLEDDMLVPYAALERWKTDSEYLYPAGYLRGFLRVKETKGKGLVNCDQQASALFKQILHINKRAYYRPPNPYSAFWIYSRHQMTEFLSSPAWKDGNREFFGIRERAAVGMTWRNTAKHTTLIPLDDHYEIPEDVLVWHLHTHANKPDHPAFDKVSVADLVRFEPFLMTILRIRKFLSL